MIAIVVLLVIVDLLTFHDIVEKHTIRDWLTFIASILVFFYFGKELKRRIK
jgi:hypothetical protein